MSRFQPEMSFGRHFGPVPPDARPAAVLVLLYPRRGQWHVPLIVRPADMPAHAGQVSLPGGVIELGEDSRQAAVRECFEEIGPIPEGIEILGQLTELYLFASNFCIVPWVGAVMTTPVWAPNPREVAQLLEIPLGHLRDPATLASVSRRQRGLEFSAPCFCWEEERIWGATSMILAEFLASLEDIPV
jgi:8-oxo-dGTP pyrophosphatase MutT (NUDIX family)